MSWDPAQYLRYGGERLRPAIDLMARISIEAPGAVLDLGCGTGNVTQMLARRWPRARIVGVDSSAAMLAVARASTQGDARREWVDADLEVWEPARSVDVVFSNAALHWQDDHAALFRRIFDWVAPRGVLAVQMPDQHGAPSHLALAELVSSARWRDRLASRLRRSPVGPAATYFGLLAPAATVVDAWTTEYLHVLRPTEDGVHPVVAWTTGTALRPYLEALDADARQAFVADYAARITALYPALADGRVLFAFRRVFIVASRAQR